MLFLLLFLLLLHRTFSFIVSCCCQCCRVFATVCHQCWRTWQVLFLIHNFLILLQLLFCSPLAHCALLLFRRCFITIARPQLIHPLDACSACFDQRWPVLSPVVLRPLKPLSETVVCRAASVERPCAALFVGVLCRSKPELLPQRRQVVVLPCSPHIESPTSCSAPSLHPVRLVLPRLLFASRSFLLHFSLFFFIRKPRVTDCLSFLFFFN